MKAAIVLAAVLAMVAAVLAMMVAAAIANAAQVIASALGAKPVATYAGVGGFAGGFFEDRLETAWFAGLNNCVTGLRPRHGVG